jgi:hypothetical protein
MLLLAALIATTQTPSAPEAGPAAPRVQVQATVRIMRPASLRVGDSQTLEGKPLRSTRIRTAEGEIVPARLAEFE